jgi:hypothetical protein
MYENVQVLEKIHLQFCRNILKIRTSTPNFMSYGEIGRVPINGTCVIKSDTQI